MSLISSALNSSNLKDDVVEPHCHPIPPSSEPSSSHGAVLVPAQTATQSVEGSNGVHPNGSGEMEKATSAARPSQPAVSPREVERQTMPKMSLAPAPVTPETGFSNAFYGTTVEISICKKTK